MLKKYSTLALVIVLLQLFNIGPVSARASAAGDKEAMAEKVRKNIEKLGVGEKARVNVKLRDGTTHKGYVYQVGQDSFTLVEDKTGQQATIAYADVQGIKGHNLSTGKKIALGVGLAAATLAITGSLLVLGFLAIGH